MGPQSEPIVALDTVLLLRKRVDACRCTQASSAEGPVGHCATAPHQLHILTVQRRYEVFISAACAWYIKEVLARASAHPIAMQIEITDLVEAGYFAITQNLVEQA